MPQRRMLLYTPVIRRGIKAGAEIYTITTGGCSLSRARPPRHRYTVHSAEWLQATARSVSSQGDNINEVLRSFFERQPRARKRPNLTSSSLKAQDLGRFCGCLDGVILAVARSGFRCRRVYITRAEREWG
jgi:hypothetical protein